MFEKPAYKTLVLGVGNTLMSDEGVGVHVIERLLAGFVIPEEVQVLDGGVLGMDLLYYLEGIENLLLIDTVETRKEPGTIIRLENDEVPAFLSMKISPHQVGVPDMLAASRLMDLYPKRIVLWGIQPEWLDMGLDVSPLVESKIDILVHNVVAQLKDWGHAVTP
ncbi:MAG: HyaD/HybD family hydrogenase maturation endopeptidase [Anaerolineales bacterium]|nr:HyaD/HybD family hydrogenase maturation endopeptidase [Anaerolineales bacterium]